MTRKLYFDNNATTPTDPQVCQAMLQELTAPPHNPSSTHALGQEANRILVQSREMIANFFSVQPSEILFTSSGTEAMNLLIRGSLNNPNAHIVGSELDHVCMYHTLRALQKGNAQVTFIGLPTPTNIKKALRPNTCLIALSAVNGETGYKLDLEEVAIIATTYHIPLIIDGVALLGKEPLTRIPEGVSGMGFSAHKFHGPQGVGFAFVRSGTTLSPLIYGGGQEYALRSGTENLPGIVGLAKAISLLNDATYSKLNMLRNIFEMRLTQLLPDIKINNPGERVSNISNIYFPNVDNESLIIALDIKNITASTASACSSTSPEPSRVLMAMGFSKQRSRCSVRFSFSRMNTQEEIYNGTKIIAQCVHKLRN